MHEPVDAAAAGAGAQGAALPAPPQDGVVFVAQGDAARHKDHPHHRAGDHQDRRRQLPRPRAAPHREGRRGRRRQHGRHGGRGAAAAADPAAVRGETTEGRGGGGQEEGIAGGVGAAGSGFRRAAGEQEEEEDQVRGGEGGGRSRVRLWGVRGARPWRRPVDGSQPRGVLELPGGSRRLPGDGSS